jgi:hypothetical protein
MPSSWVLGKQKYITSCREVVPKKPCYEVYLGLRYESKACLNEKYNYFFRLEHVDIDIQELLQLQYEGVAVMNIFGKAKINVNLLLHLLNAKFYGRKRK